MLGEKIRALRHRAKAKLAGSRRAGRQQQELRLGSWKTETCRSRLPELASIGRPRRTVTTFWRGGGGGS